MLNVRTLLCIVFILSIASAAHAADSTLYSVGIAGGSLASGKTIDTLDIILDMQGNEMAAVDLKVATTNSNFEISQVLKGAICDSCNWEFFNAKRLKDIEEASLFSVWQIVTLADMMPDSVVPSCYGWKSPGSIARLVINKKRDPLSMEATDSINFLWQDCSDNSISNRTGVVLAISTLPDTVGFSGTVPMSLEFPNIIAAPGSCIKPDKKDRVKRLIEFEAGQIRYVSDSVKR
jgi:hypothetical protein